MRLSKKKHSMFVQPRSLFCAIFLSGAVIAPGLAHASTVMTPSQMRLEAEKARSQQFDFEATCGVDGVSSLSLGYPAYAAQDPSYPPEMAKCVVFGNQDQARFLCMCADLEDPVTGDVPADKLPKLGNPETGPDAFDSFEELCTGQFNAACGPFPEPLEVECGNEKGECGLFARGNKREGGLNHAYAGCECYEGFAWELSQNFNEDFFLDQAGADALCAAQLDSCNRSVNDPVLHDFQSLPASAYTHRSFGCMAETEERLDECVVYSGNAEGQDSFQCFCSGTEMAGEVDVDRDGAAQGMAQACGELLTRCEQFDPEGSDEQDESEKDWPEDEGGSTWEDILDALGCRAAPSSGFGFQSLLGFGALILLGGRFRRRRGE